MELTDEEKARKERELRALTAFAAGASSKTALAFAQLPLTARQANDALIAFHNFYPSIVSWHKQIQRRLAGEMARGMLVSFEELNYADIEHRIASQLREGAYGSIEKRLISQNFGWPGVGIHRTLTARELHMGEPTQEEIPENPYPVYAKKIHKPSALLLGLVKKI